MAIGAKTTTLAAVLVGAVCLYFGTRVPEAESLHTADVGEGEEERSEADLVSPEEELGQAAVTRQVEEGPVVEEESVAPEPLGANVLRVVLDGITDEEARETEVKFIARDEDGQIDGADRTWMGQGLTSEFDLDAVFALGEVGAMRVNVKHPSYLGEFAWIDRVDGVESEDGQTVFERRFTFAPTKFWPELILSVRDAETRAHLEGVELHCITSDIMNQRRQPGPGLPYSELGRGLASPIALKGGYEDGEPEEVGAIAVGSHVVDLPHRAEATRGVIVYAWAPGYGWGRLSVDFSASGEREVLLSRGAELSVRLTNVQLDRYPEVMGEPTLFVHQPGWGVGFVWVQELDETLATEGLHLQGLEPGEFSVVARLGAEWAGRKPVELAREEFPLAAGEVREVVLTLPDPPAPVERVPLGGVVSFSSFDREDELRMHVYQGDWRWGDPDYVLTPAEMERVGSSPSRWAFQLEDMPVGKCQIHLMPFAKSWMVEVPEGGREDLELVIPELGEVHVETVDARTGERVPVEELRYMYTEEVPGRMRSHWLDRDVVEYESEPGLFRLWMAPGSAHFAGWNLPSDFGYAPSGTDFELVPGVQSVRLEMAPPYTFKIEFHVDGAALTYDDRIFWGLHEAIHAIDHEGHAEYVHQKIAVTSSPGVYEVRFEGSEQYHPAPAQRVEVREGETVEVIVELTRR